MPRKLIVPKKKNDTYYQILVGEVLEDLGTNINWFRNLKNTIQKSKTDLLNDLDDNALLILDSIYQHSLDTIFDELANANDLRCAKVAIECIEKSVRVRRGLLKKSEVLK